MAEFYAARCERHTGANPILPVTARVAVVIMSLSASLHAIRVHRHATIRVCSLDPCPGKPRLRPGTDAGAGRILREEGAPGPRAALLRMPLEHGQEGAWRSARR